MKNKLEYKSKKKKQKTKWGEGANNPIELFEGTRGSNFCPTQAKQIKDINRHFCKEDI